MVFDEAESLGALGSKAGRNLRRKTPTSCNEKYSHQWYSWLVGCICIASGYLFPTLKLQERGTSLPSAGREMSAGLQVPMPDPRCLSLIETPRHVRSIPVLLRITYRSRTSTAVVPPCAGTRRTTRSVELLPSVRSVTTDSLTLCSEQELDSSELTTFASRMKRRVLLVCLLELPGLELSDSSSAKPSSCIAGLLPSLNRTES
mmetsp:Transcript_2326/g.6916  ORF Transcript_2326/g.6916 Transcript_2326/m.6916 type:complete len:203 (+) Transcript_2326:733-1341(+)